MPCSYGFDDSASSERGRDGDRKALGRTPAPTHRSRKARLARFRLGGPPATITR